MRPCTNNRLRLIGHKLLSWFNKVSIIFARWVLLRALADILTISARAGNGSMLARKYMIHEIDVFILFREYKRQGYKVKLK
jgi:hypothetical protein